MADNKHALTRYQTLDRCFRNPGRRYFINDLLHEVNSVICEINPNCSGIKIRQLRDDISFMRSEAGFQAPIETLKEGKKAYYRYTDLSFSINNQPLNEKEAQQLKEAMQTLKRFKGLPQFEWLEETMVRLDQTFHFGEDRKVIEFDENIFLKGREHLGNLYNAIVNCQTLLVKYKTFSDLELNVTISPYYLKEYNNRWFLFAYCHQENKLMNLPLDRIESIKEAKVDFLPNVGTDFEEYFEDVIGVSISPDKNCEKITLKIDSRLWPYIQTKPIHGSQKVKQSNVLFTIIELELIPNYELEARILSFGEDVEVVGPQALREIIAQRTTKLQAKYF